MEYTLITTEEQLVSEKETWDKLCAEMLDTTPFQTWEWNYVWWKNNEPTDSLFVIKAFENKKVYGYAPLVVKGNVAEFIGGKDMDYGRFVVCHKEGSVIEGFIQFLLDRKIGLALQEMSAGCSQLHFLQKLLENKKHVLVYKTTRTTHVSLGKYASFDEYFSLLRKSMRYKTIKVGLKKGLTLGKEPVTDELLQEICAIYLNRQEVRVGTSTLDWACKIIKGLYEKGLLNVYMARKGDEGVGFLVSMLHKNKQYFWLVAFKQEYKDCFPGQLLFYQAIKDGFEDGNDAVDFMRGDYDFKMRWECAIDTNYTVFWSKKWAPYFKKKTVVKWRSRIKKLVYGNRLLKRMYEKRGK